MSLFPLNYLLWLKHLVPHEIQVVRVDTQHLVPDLRGYALTFSPFSVMLVVHYYCGEILLHPICSEILLWQGVKFYQMAFLHLLRWYNVYPLLCCCSCYYFWLAYITANQRGFHCDNTIGVYSVL
jgi:hypothetical protein